MLCEMLMPCHRVPDPDAHQVPQPDALRGPIAIRGIVKHIYLYIYYIIIYHIIKSY